MIFEVRKGRLCDSVAVAQAKEIEKQGLELIAIGTALKLSESKYSTLYALLENQKESKEILSMQFALDKSKLERKIKKRNKLIIGELGVILIILLL